MLKRSECFIIGYESMLESMKRCETSKARPDKGASLPIGGIAAQHGSWLASETQPQRTRNQQHLIFVCVYSPCCNCKIWRCCCSASVNLNFVGRSDSRATNVVESHADLHVNHDAARQMMSSIHCSLRCIISLIEYRAATGRSACPLVFTLRTRSFLRASDR